MAPFRSPNLDLSDSLTLSDAGSASSNLQSVNARMLQRILCAPCRGRSRELTGRPLWSHDLWVILCVSDSGTDRLRVLQRENLAMHALCLPPYKLSFLAASC
jgi:hypothetical protein